jgi:NAD(P)-dependent dehydrogenase (short-subunit alcohol dehydrogenase family)
LLEPALQYFSGLRMGRMSKVKAVIRSFARTWTTELKDRRIGTNVLGPGPVATPVLAAQV